MHTDISTDDGRGSEAVDNRNEAPGLEQPQQAKRPKRVQKGRGRTRGLQFRAGSRGRSIKRGQAGESTVKTMQNAHQAMQLRLSGATLQQIGEQLGYASSSARNSAHRLITRALDEIRTEITDMAERMRALDCARLERLLLALWPRAVSNPPDVEASRQAARIIQQLSRLRGTEVQPSPTIPLVPPTGPSSDFPTMVQLVFVNAPQSQLVNDPRVVGVALPNPNG